MTYFLRNGNTFNISDSNAIDISDVLPAGNYVVKYDNFSGKYYLEMVDSFSLPAKMYGNVNRYADRIMNTFESRSGSTGVLLVGEKGSGKTLLLKMLSTNAAVFGVPTIIINTPFKGDGFNTFIQMIDQPLVVVFDEFEKVYDYKEQEQLLTLLDGVYSSKKLFIITSNSKYAISEHMTNRPGRLFYMIEYEGLEKDFIIEYCNDNLVDKSQIDDLVTLTMLYTSFNFDMLKSVVEEMNRYNETASQVISIVNAKPVYRSDGSEYSIRLTIGGKPTKISNSNWYGSPLEGAIKIKPVDENYNDDEFEDEDDSEVIIFDTTHIVSADFKKGIFTYYREDQKAEMVLTRAYSEKEFNLTKLLS